jgi:hypothetical protein
MLGFVQHDCAVLQALLLYDAAVCSETVSDLTACIISRHDCSLLLMDVCMDMYMIACVALSASSLLTLG